MNDSDRDRLDKIEKKLDMVYYAIVGNELDEGHGMAERLKKLETEFNTLSKHFDRIKWVTIGYAIGAGAAAGSLISALFGKAL